MAKDDLRDRWRTDREHLSRLGQAFTTQPNRVTVRVPIELARLAIAAWERDDIDGETGPESAEEAMTRHRAASLALIGLSLAERGRPDGRDLVVDLDPWLVGDAILAVTEDHQQ